MNPLHKVYDLAETYHQPSETNKQWSDKKHCYSVQLVLAVFQHCAGQGFTQPW